MQNANGEEPGVSAELEESINGCLPYDDSPQQIYLAQVPTSIEDE